MKKINVMVVYGAYGYPEENWFTWLKHELNALGVQCCIPILPTPQGQDLHHWLIIFEQNYQHLIDHHTIMIGHSLGAVFLLRWLEQRSSGIILSVMLVGAFLKAVEEKKFDDINHSFLMTPFDWQKIKQKAKEFICYHGSNDPYVQREEFEMISDQLQAKKIIISEAGHFNSAFGYSNFPHLLNQLKSYLH